MNENDVSDTSYPWHSLMDWSSCLYLNITSDNGW